MFSDGQLSLTAALGTYDAGGQKAGHAKHVRSRGALPSTEPRNETAWIRDGCGLDPSQVGTSAIVAYRQAKGAMGVGISDQLAGSFRPTHR
jgi:hypothetical protein